ncbi:MAG: hypothetical protein N2316_00465 [Spirochaetes bacterium]|nr:hypothetical protein [Spirochaetota bacterium]
MSTIFNRWEQVQRPSTDFFEYWEQLGFFDNIQTVLPSKFFILFEIAQVIFTSDLVSEALQAIEDISREEKIETPDRDQTILVNRVERVSPLSDNMVIDSYKTIYDLKKALPRELAWEDDIFDIKLFTKSLLVQRFFETEGDKFKPISTLRDETGKEANRFEQKFYLLFDSSKSMDFKMRIFYAKCIVAEFLRRKMNSKAKIFFRSFDSEVGKLFKLERRQDFSNLIEEVLYLTTGGVSTNLQQAVFQAISDIKYDKEMLNSEILVVTDGISKINKFAVRERLGDIKLNILKIGSDLAEGNFYDMKEIMDTNKIDFDPSAVNLNEVRKKVSQKGGEEGLTITEKRAYRFLLNYSEQIFKDLKEVCHRFVEIPDLEPSRLFSLKEETLDFIEMTANEFLRADVSNKSLEERTKLYKKAYFLSEYIEFLMDYCNSAENPILQKCYEKIKSLRQKLLEDPILNQIITRAKSFKEDRKTLKLSRKEARKRLKEMKLQQKHLTRSEMKKAMVLLTMDVGEGSMGQFFMLLVVKLWELLKKIFYFIVRHEKKRRED